MKKSCGSKSIKWGLFFEKKVKKYAREIVGNLQPCKKLIYSCNDKRFKLKQKSPTHLNVKMKN